jgi:aminopeptidase 2
VTADLNQALELDAKLSSHPIEVECPDANHIFQVTDTLKFVVLALSLMEVNVSDLRRPFL